MADSSPFDPDSLLIGSDPRRVELVAQLKTVSGVHCRLLRIGADEYALEDLGSTNGTFVHGERLAPNEPQPVGPGDLIGLGRKARLRLGSMHLRKWLDPEAFAPPVTLEFEGDERQTDRAPAPRRPARGATTHLPSVELARLGQVLDEDDGSGPLEDLSTRVERIPEPPRPAARAVSISIGYAESNDITIPNTVVSGRHARIYLDQGRFLLEDQGSTNGTWHEGRRIQRAVITVGESFSLGSYQLEFSEELAIRLRAKLRDSEDSKIAEVPIAAGTEYVVGREPDCDIVLNAPMVSGRHASLRVLPGQDGYLLQDRGSTNGTFLNSRDNPVIEPTRVGMDDVLYFGSYRFPVSRIAAMVGGRRDSSAVQRRTIVVGRDPSVDVTIDNLQVSRRHLEVTVLDDGAYELRDLGSSNGVYVNGERIRGRHRATERDSIKLGSIAVHLDPEAGVVFEEYEGDIMIQAEHISIDVRDAKSPDRKKRILSDVSFTAYPTEFVGLMGPSGAGKTTLMLALNGYTPPSEGRSLINGDNLYENYNSFRGTIGYVPQDDIVFPQLTVYESLYYTARLRLPADTDREEIDRRIDQILDKLEIQQTRHVLIGDALKKGISGGQRKRVNLAQELITEPALLFLDEPTSGLASEDTLNVMRLLRSLADEGRTILLTIHQPSLEAYRLMDNVIYLFQGRLVYYGPAYPDSILHFNEDVPAGPERERLLSDPGNALKPLAIDQREAFEADSTEERERQLETRIEQRVSAYNRSSYHRDFVADRTSDDTGNVQLSGKIEKTERSGVFRQWKILTERAARIKWKDRLNTFILMVQAPIIATVLALVFSAPSDTNSYFSGLSRGPAALFLLVASAVWFGCSNSAREIVSEQAIYRRERMVNLMIPSYVLSKFAVLGVVCALQCLMLLGIVYAPLNLEGSFFTMYGLLLLTSLTGLGMGLTLSAVVSSAEAAVALVPLLLIPQIILGGVIMPVHDMNLPMKVLSSAMAARWGFEAMLYEEYEDDDLTRIREECDIPDCVWSIGPNGYTYYAGDPEAELDPVEFAGVEALEGIIPAKMPEDEAVCQAFCPSVRNGDEITPLDRSFGADRRDPVRVAAVEDIIEEGNAPNEYTVPTSNARTSMSFCAWLLASFNLFLLALVMAILKARDVEVG